MAGWYGNDWVRLQAREAKLFVMVILEDCDDFASCRTASRSSLEKVVSGQLFFRISMQTLWMFTALTMVILMQSGRHCRNIYAFSSPKNNRFLAVDIPALKL